MRKYLFFWIILSGCFSQMRTAPFLMTLFPDVIGDGNYTKATAFGRSEYYLKFIKGKISKNLIRSIMK